MTRISEGVNKKCVYIAELVDVFRWHMRLLLFLIFSMILGSAHGVRALELPLSISPSGEVGPYTVKQWKQDWPGCEFEGGVQEGRISVIESDGLRWLHVNFVKGKIGPEEGGAGWRMPFAKQESAELSYTLRFSKDFDFVKGGKLPGLCGGPENVSGGHRATGTNGFSARLMWRKDGRGEAYVYHKNQKGDYGDSFAFPSDFRFPTETPVKVRMSITMNAPGGHTGSLRVWLTLQGQEERLMVERPNMEWRTVNTFGVDGLYFETFHGGGDASWAPTRACWVEFSELKVQSMR